MSNGVKGHSDKTKVLIVEDNEINRELVRAVLSTAYPDMELIDADSGPAAVQMYRTHHPGMVLMDVHLPEQDGLSAAREIRDYERTAGLHVPIYALTADTLLQDEQDCRTAGMDGMLLKPITPASLRALLKPNR